jgi:hypothetical protein
METWIRLRACSKSSQMRGGKVSSPSFMRFIAIRLAVLARACRSAGEMPRNRARRSFLARPRGQRNGPEVLVNQPQIPLVVGNADFYFLREPSASEHPGIDMVNVVRGPDEEHLIAGIELAHQHQTLLDELDLVLAHVVPIVATR